MHGGIILWKTVGVGGKGDGGVGQRLCELWVGSFSQWSLGSDLSDINLSLLPSTRGIIAAHHDGDI